MSKLDARIEFFLTAQKTIEILGLEEVKQMFQRLLVSHGLEEIRDSLAPSKV